MNADAVLGGLLLNNSAFDDVAALINADCFTTKQHRMIWQAISDRTLRGEPCDVVTLSEYLKQHGASGNVLSYLGEIAKNTPSAANVVSYARILRSEWIGRQMRDACGLALSSEESPETVLATLENTLLQLSQHAHPGGLTPMADYIGEWNDHLHACMNMDSDVVGLATGLHALDEKIGGLKDGDFCIVAGRPSMGKTALASQISDKSKKWGGMFSMEMPKQQIISRHISTTARIPLEHINKPRLLTDEQREKIADALDSARKSRLLIDDASGLSIHEIRARARAAHRRYGLGVVIVDYIGLAKSEKENRNQEITEISSGLKALAKDLSVPVIALSQLNRSVEQRANKRPMMSDLRDSGSIEQDADQILLLYRDDYYNPHSPNKGIAEVNVAKNRNGPTGVVHLAWIPEITRFENLAPDWEPMETPAPTGGFQAKPGDRWRKGAEA